MNDRSRTRPWPEVVGFYRDLVEEQGAALAPMLALVEFLAASRYATALFPCPSNQVLGIGRAPDFTPGDDELQVRFDRERQTFAFTQRRRDALHPWSRECQAGEWRAVLERIFHKRLQWFHEG
jgi:hypothetical protein